MEVKMRLKLQWRKCCIFILATCFAFGQCLTHEKMRKHTHCADSVLSSAHRYQVLKSRSLLECLALCRPDGQCKSIVFDADQFLCHFCNTLSAENCSNMEPIVGRLRFYEEMQMTLEPASQSTDTVTQISSDATTLSTTDEGTETPTDSTTSTAFAETSPNPCQNGGHLDGTGSCVCVNSHVGTYCENIMQDCTEGRSSGYYTTHGVYQIQPALSPTPFPVYCQMVNLKARTYILNRNDPAFTFNRTWQDFRDGFGDVSSDFWLGLDKIRQLTKSKAYQLRFRFKPNGTAVYSFHGSFVLSDEASGYNLTIGHSLSPSVDDCMRDLQGARFSTYDNDNDDNLGINCAAVFGGGWWYKGANCSACNVMGPVLSGNGLRLGTVSEMFWSGFGNSYPFPLIAYLMVP